ncbi:hypothetical protein LTS08_001685 [Lithohypha guttulata]|nr:hypothetical protein LTS08_001685 [Lithohypha guttulata]
MPPTRTIPPAKAVKTERTHEENQERAYIAASRRSDRSLEARVESARRASEIHKRRTGRSLRVTEQDVINEEMYEEEDDDLPMQYRRLTAHLQTGSSDFNRRLAAYLTNQVAMRNAVEQMANNSYNQQYGQQQMPYNQPRPNMFQPSIQHQQQPAPQHPAPLGAYRQAPYPSPHHPGFRQNHGRAYSSAVMPTSKAQTPPTPVSMSLDHRRMSTPSTVPSAIDTGAVKADPDYLRQTQSAIIPQTHFNPYWQDMTPFTTSLPPESQQMLAGVPALNMNDQFSASLMHGSEQYVGSPYYPWGNDFNHGMKPMPYHPAVSQGMSATLAPSALATTTEPQGAASGRKQHPTFEGNFPSSHLDPLGLDHLSVPGKEGISPYSIASGQNTPGESFWSNFVQDGGWTDDATIGA